MFEYVVDGVLYTIEREFSSDEPILEERLVEFYKSKYKENNTITNTDN